MFMRSLHLLPTLLLALCVALFAHTASAASACKGLSSTACAAKSSCSWVGGHKRKDGARVKAHCRSKGKKSSKKKTDKGKKKSSGKSDSKKKSSSGS